MKSKMRGYKKIVPQQGTEGRSKENRADTYKSCKNGYYKKQDKGDDMVSGCV
jgi:hypothetical protein